MPTNTRRENRRQRRLNLSVRGPIQAIFVFLVSSVDAKLKYPRGAYDTLRFSLQVARALVPFIFPMDVSTFLSNSSTSDGILIRSSSSHYRETNFDPHPEDRPLFVQFCGHDPALLLASAKYVEKDCDAVDLNLVSPARVTLTSM